MTFIRIDGIGNGNESRDTHTTQWYKHGFKQAMSYFNHQNDIVIVDPFARGCPWGTITNDLNPTYKTTRNMDALEFLKEIPSNLAHCVLWDPPFSSRQEKEYGTSSNLYSDPGYIYNCFKEISRITRSGAVVLQLGYNSTQYAKCLSLQNIWLVNHGVCKNDTVMTLWRKNISSLYDFS